MGDATLDRQSIAALTVGAMTPCMRLYAFLGEEIVKHLDEDYTKSTYHEWIKKYSSKDFQSATLQVEHLLDTLAENLAEDDVSKLGRLYSQAMTLELEFFSAQPKCQCALLPFVRRQVDGIDASYLLIMDFDFTCSVMDSCSPLANASIQAAMQRVESDSARCHQISGLELRKRWESLEKSYGENYSKLIDVIEHQEHNVTHFDADGLHSFLERLSEFEVQANSAVIEQEVFDGLKLEDAQEEGHNVVFQEGCPNFLRQISLHNNVTAHVISVCWSKSYIEGALSEEGLDFIEVHSNEFITNGSSTLGGIKRLVETPFDKERVMKELIRNADGLLGPIRSIFIGDSVSDILCLLEADLGIVIGSNPRLQRVTEAFGVTLLPLYKGVVSQVQLGNLEFTKNAGILYTVRDWHEIQAFMISNLGYSAKTPP
ncbi:hypothetical protein KP509_06G045600 [Ceratopteris richardii]|nr:hypothetical protein KP509_06G045600 [Ceratopteris richardii]